jgi:hypothetical protein
LESDETSCDFWRKERQQNAAGIHAMSFLTHRPDQLMPFATLEKTIKDEEMERMAALEARQGAPLTDGQRRACLERILDRMAAARTSVYRMSISRSLSVTSAPPLPAGGEEASL